MDIGDCWTNVAEYLTSFRDLSSLMLVNSKCSSAVCHLDNYWNTKIGKLKQSALYQHESLKLQNLDSKIEQVEKGQVWNNRRQLLLALIDQIRQVLSEVLQLNTLSLLGNCDVEFLDRRKISQLSDKFKSTPHNIKVSFSFRNFGTDLLLFRKQVDVEALLIEPNATFHVNDNLSIYFENDFNKKFHEESHLVIIPFRGYPIDYDDIDKLSSSIPRVLLLTINRIPHQKAIWTKNLSSGLIELFTDENITQISKSMGAFTFLEATNNIESVRNLLLEYIAKIYEHCSQNVISLTIDPSKQINKQNNKTETPTTVANKKQRKSKECIIS